MLKVTDMTPTDKLTEDTSQILSQIVDTVRFLIGCDKASVVLWSDKEQSFALSVSSERLNQSVAQRVRRQGGVTRWIIDNQKPLLINDVNLNPFTQNEITIEGGIQAFLGVPISFEDRPLGVLYALSLHPFAFSEPHVAVMHSLSHMAALTIINAQQADEQRQLNAFKDTMMSLAAHDLRNPLGRIAGYFGLMVDDFGPFDEVHQPWVDEIFRAIYETFDLIDGILDYERINQAANIDAHQPKNLNDLVLKVADKTKSEASQKNQIIECNLADEPIIIDMDEFLMNEAISNLVFNAQKYSDENTIIRIETQITNNEYQLSVSDEGIGISPEDHDKIFEPFTRLKSAKSQRGSGLGLNLVKTIISRHGGQITLQSAVNQGSTFTIHFPRSKST